jgi:spore cortex formation protein SpoVR/YcgB (stage V sporulation)
MSYSDKMHFTEETVAKLIAEHGIEKVERALDALLAQANPRVADWMTLSSVVRRAKNRKGK